MTQMPAARSLPVVDSVPQRTLPEPAEQHFVLDDFGVQRISDEASAALACVITICSRGTWSLYVPELDFRSESYCHSG